MGASRYLISTLLPFVIFISIISSTHGNDGNIQQTRDYKDQLDSGLMPLYDMSEWFLSIVQLSYLYDLQETLGIEFTSFEQFGKSWEDNWEEWLAYLIGFVICASVGVVLIIGMALSGGIVACCRCCGNCGGKNPPKKQKVSSCVVVGCGISLFIITLAIILGIIGLFASNEVIKNRLRGESGDMDDTNVLSELIMSLEGVEGYFDDTVDDLNVTVLGGYQTAQNELFETLDNISSDALMALDEDTGVVGNLTELYEFTLNLENTQESANTSLEIYDELDKITEELNTELENVKSDTIGLIESCFSQECNDTKDLLDSLSIQSNISSTDLETQLFAVISAIGAAFNGGIIEKANQSVSELQKISAEIDEKLADPINSTKSISRGIEDDIEEFIGEISEEVNNIDLQGAIDALESVEDEFDIAGSATYWSFLFLGVIICIIVVCNLIGLGLGSFCPQPRRGDGGCDCSSAMGADWLLAGLAFTFIFYWLFTTITMSLFLGVGIGHTELCRHLINYNDAKSSEVLDIFDRMITTSIYNNTGVDIEVLGLYTECANDTSFYNALELDRRGYNISEIVDLSKVEEAVNEIKNVDINVPSIELIDENFVNILKTLNSAMDLLMFQEYYDELSQPVVNESLTQIAEMLDNIAETEDIVDLYEEAQKFRNLSITHVEPAEELQTELTSSLEEVEQATKVNLTDIALNLQSAEETINTNGNDTIANFINTTADDIYADIVAFSDNLESEVRNDVGNCRSLYDAITFGIDATCVKTFYPLNAFWYSLGWILFFLFPSIIFSFKLVTEYRVQDEDETGYDAFESPVSQEQWSMNGHPSAMLLKEMDKPATNGKSADRDSGVGEFDNPLYMTADGTEFKIPRPSMVSASSDTTSADFKIPRPKVSRNNSYASSYNSVGRRSGSHPVAEDTEL